MPFNGNGVFTRVYNWVADAAAAIPITAARVDGEDDGYATGLSNCICKDGQTTIAANLPMSGFIHTGVGNASARTQYAVVGQIQDSIYNWVSGGGSADVITATYAPAVTTLVDGMELNFRATAANATTTPTFSPNGLTAHTITKNGGSALGAGDISAALAECGVRYNLANTRWELMNPAVTSQTPFLDTNALIKGSSDATKLMRFEVDGNTTGTTRVYTVPDFNGTLATLAGVEAFSNKSLTDSNTFIVDDGDVTKKLAFQCSGITTGTTRTVTVPDKSGTMAMTSDSTFVKQTRTVVVTSTTGATAIPYDDSIPQISEGNQFMSLAITPASSSNVLVIDVTYYGSTSGVIDLTAALFQDSNVNALAAGSQVIDTGLDMHCITFKYTMTAGTTSATTFTVRGGSSSGTTTFNGSGGTRKLGGVLSSSIVISEYTA